MYATDLLHPRRGEVFEEMHNTSDDGREHNSSTTADAGQRATQRTHAVSQDEFEANLDLVDCSECGRQFNLGAQSYFGPRCPSCRTDD